MVHNPKSVRPWQHVFDPLNGYLLLGMHMYKKNISFSGSWNFGPNDENLVNVSELVKCIISQWKSGSYIIDKSVDKPHETTYLKLDSSKARSLLGWRPKYNIDKAIEMTVDWYKNFYSSMKRDDLYDFSVRQYMKKV